MCACVCASGCEAASEHNALVHTRACIKRCSVCVRCVSCSVCGENALCGDYGACVRAHRHGACMWCVCMRCVRSSNAAQELTILVPNSHASTAAGYSPCASAGPPARQQGQEPHAEPARCAPRHLQHETARRARRHLQHRRSLRPRSAATCHPKMRRWTPAPTRPKQPRASARSKPRPCQHLCQAAAPGSGRHTTGRNDQPEAPSRTGGRGGAARNSRSDPRRPPARRSGAGLQRWQNRGPLHSLIPQAGQRHRSSHQHRTSIAGICW